MKYNTGNTCRCHRPPFFPVSFASSRTSLNAYMVRHGRGARIIRALAQPVGYTVYVWVGDRIHPHRSPIILIKSTKNDDSQSQLHESIPREIKLFKNITKNWGEMNECV